MTSYWLSGIAGLLIGGAVIGGVQQYRIKNVQLTLAQERQSRADASAQAIRDALDKTVGWQKGVDDAITSITQTQTRIDSAQSDLDRTLRAGAAATAGMRADLARVPERVAQASSASVAGFAAACTDVLGAMAAGGDRLAERGAGIAAEADRRGAEAVTLDKAWPK